MRKFIIFTLFFSLLPRFAGALEKAAPGVVSAQKLKRLFEQMDKPAFQKAYYENLEDLKTISETQKAPDNELIYKMRKGHVRTVFGHLYAADRRNLW